MPGPRMLAPTKTPSQPTADSIVFARFPIVIPQSAIKQDYSFWRGQLEDGINGIVVGGTTLQREKAKRIIERVYRSKFEELELIFEQDSARILQGKSQERSGQIIEKLSRISAIHHQALLARSLAGAQLYWNDVLTTPDLPPIPPPPEPSNKIRSEGRKLLKNWFIDHADNPYPSKIEKDELSRATGLTIKQIEYFSWNLRKRSKETETKSKKK